MDRQPVLEGELLWLRPLSPSDWAALFAVASDPLIWQVHPQHNRWQELVFRQFFEEALARGGAMAIVDRADNRLIGSSRWERHDPAEGGVVEIGWTFLARSHWGGAANRDLKRLMLTHAFGFVARVVFRVGEDNLRSRRAMEKIGGRLMAQSTVEETASGPVRHVVYEIARDAFLTGPLAR